MSASYDLTLLVTIQYFVVKIKRAGKYNKYTYPIQDANTRQLIRNLKSSLRVFGLYFTGRFADWEYYNMDVAMGAAMDMVKSEF